MKIMNWLKAFIKRQFEEMNENLVRSKLPQLQELPFFFEIHYGEGVHHCDKWKSLDRKFHSDAHFAVIVTRGGKVSGVIGFGYIGRTVFVREMMGAPRSNFHDGTVTVEEYLFQCAMEIAKVLGAKHLRFITPETITRYWIAARGEDFSPDQREKILSHMKRMYGHVATKGLRREPYWRIRDTTFLHDIA